MPNNFLSRLKDFGRRSLNIGWMPFRNIDASRIFFMHSVHPIDRLSHRPGQFRSYLKLLAEHEIKTYGVSTLLAQTINTSSHQRLIGLTFDDGYSDNLRWAAPLLLEFDCNATFYVVAGMISTNRRLLSSSGYRLYSERPMLSASDVRELDSLGFEIGSHTLSHNSVSTLFKSDPRKAFADLCDSKKFLEDLIGKEVVSFAYPYGQQGAFSDKTHALGFAAGYKSLATTMWGRLDQSRGRILHRCEVSCNDSTSVFARKLAGGEDYRRWVCLMRRSGSAWGSDVFAVDDARSA